VEKRLMAGYQFVDSSPAPFPPQAQAHGYQGSFNEPPSDEGEEEATEVMLEKSGVLRRSLPYFPDDLFDHLPKLLTEGLKMARHPRERDMLLLGMLANLSGCLPQVKLLYDQVYYSPHFYFLAIAHAGGGKGVLSLAALLPNAIAKHYEQQNEQTMKVYNQAMQDWDVEQRKALSERRAADLSLCPERPKLITLKVSPNISKSRLILYLEANGKLGVIINAPELDMVSGAIRQDCGKHDDVFRAAFQHEEVSSDYKIDGRQVMAHHPHLACCFSGTPDQLSKFIVSWENGLYSRMTIYAGEADWVWRSAAPREQGTDSRAVFIELSRELLEMHLFLLQSPTEVVFSTEQWEQHTQRFGRWLQEVVGEKENSPGAIVLRHGLMAIRIASILTTLRKCECPFCTPQYSCTDEDFTTAMQLVEVLIEHSLLLSTALISDETHTRKLRSFFRLRPILDSLDVTFTYHEYITEVKKKEMPISTAKRLLSKAVRCYLLDKDDDKYTKKLITPLMGKA
ncbi:MAG: YfjI family protein, partial [Bacteroides sp.]